MSAEENIGIEKQVISNYPKEQIFRSALRAAVETNLPIALWQLPGREELHLMVSFDKVQSQLKLDLEEIGSGFTFSPFDTSKERLFINNDFHCRVLSNKIELSNNSKNNIDSQETEFLKVFHQQLELNSESKTGFHKGEKKEVSRNSSDYINLVETTIEAIKSGKFQKAVPARQIEITLDKNFDPIGTFLALCHAYPNAFISLVSIPKIGTWLGATPEVLLEVEGTNIFKTVALAATQKRNPEKTTGDTAWTQKEIEEQAMVSRFIINCFKKIRLREFEERAHPVHRLEGKADPAASTAVHPAFSMECRLGPGSVRVQVWVGPPGALPEKRRQWQERQRSS